MVACDGDVAQMGERLPCTEEVRGSSPLISTYGEALDKSVLRCYTVFAHEKARSMIEIYHIAIE
jgi:hypothetical protein